MDSEIDWLKRSLPKDVTWSVMVGDGMVVSQRRNVLVIGSGNRIEQCHNVALKGHDNDIVGCSGHMIVLS